MPTGRKGTFEEEIHYRGFLANVDASIRKLSFDYGFKIEVFPERDAMNFIVAIDKVPNREAAKILFMEYPCLNTREKQVYSIHNTLKIETTAEDHVLFNRLARFTHEFIEGYLKPSIRLMRLFREGNLQIPLQYYYTIENGKPVSFMSLRGRPVLVEPYHLETSELDDLHKFLHDTKIPFEKDFLQLAFDNYELSYELSNISSSFLTLMISLEILLNPGESELKHHISRNVAVLLGNTDEESNMIFSEVKNLYDERSKIVHAGKSKAIDQDKLLRLRRYVRESIKRMYHIRKSRDEILAILDQLGFGEGATLNPESRC